MEIGDVVRRITAAIDRDRALMSAGIRTGRTIVAVKEPGISCSAAVPAQIVAGATAAGTHITKRKTVDRTRQKRLVLHSAVCVSSIGILGVAVQACDPKTAAGRRFFTALVTVGICTRHRPGVRRIDARVARRRIVLAADRVGDRPRQRRLRVVIDGSRHRTGIDRAFQRAVV